MCTPCFKYTAVDRQLELYRAHTYTSAYHALLHHAPYTCVVDDLYLCTRGQLCTSRTGPAALIHACNSGSSDACRPCHSIRSIVRPIFHQIQHSLLLRCLDVKIWWIFCGQQWQWRQNGLATLPLEHVRRVISIPSVTCTSYILEMQNKMQERQD